MVAAVLLAGPMRANAFNRDVKAVLLTSGYGLLSGTAMGVLSYPLTQNPRSIFIGTSLGLYFGVAAGIYFILNRDNPNNPLYHEGYPSLRRPVTQREGSIDVDPAQAFWMGYTFSIPK